MTTEDISRSPVSAVTDLSASDDVVDSNQATPRSKCNAHFDTTTAHSSLPSDDNPTEQTQLSQSEIPFPDEPIQGWPRLAMLMAMKPNFAAFSRFRDLNVKSLLYYQAELTLLRRELHDLEYNDAGKGEIWAERADALARSDSVQFKTVKEMRVVLKEYNEALLQYQQICALPHAEPYNMQMLRRWLRGAQQGDYSIGGSDGLENTWGDLYNPFMDQWNPRKRLKHLLTRFFSAGTPRVDHADLVATAPQNKIDGLTRWIVWELMTSWKDWRKSRKDGDRIRTPNVAYDWNPPGIFNPTPTPENWWSAKVKDWDTLESRALRVTSGISTIIACLLPVAAISILSQLHGLRNLLICVAVFALVFGLVLLFLTQGTSSRTEIFAATAAFSAVMVVFISVPPAPITNIVMAPGSPTPSVSPSPTTLL